MPNTLRRSGLAVVFMFAHCAWLSAQTAPATATPAASSVPAPAQTTVTRPAGGVPRPAAGTASAAPANPAAAVPNPSVNGGTPAAANARGPRRGGGGMGGLDPTSMLPKFNGAQEKLFGDNKQFTATLNAKVSNSGNGTLAVPYEYANGKARATVDTIKAMTATGDPQAMMMSGMIQSSGLSEIVVISRPDEKTTYMIFPGIKSYVQTALPGAPAANATAGTTPATAPADIKMDVTEIGKETLDGHPTVKNAVVLTDAQGAKNEMTVWNATDLKNFPIKIETPVNGGGTAVVSFTNVKLEAPKAEDFDAPTGFIKYDSMQAMMQVIMLQMMGGAGAMPGGMPGGTPGASSMPSGMPGMRGAPAAP